ncbi:type VI secretion protein [Burkholderia cepacia]|uniref:type VI secretion system baseplate subunit TssF n=1 Tax=Burkholderia cepacia TaxID=292 RepID=UPI000757EEC2|nr:type VI secretion system baseplate subunit TssF [Burkholderia cepacia]KVS53641.1 type VI secretion protein [Burkholderia cepacia]KVS58988.1 type VI secretion protein [Burkholderia cepacia]RQT71880.1 type VI secretion system baseplate subunit TssF [Burkholderia cepacia]RQT92294.1 type VI secretion system baseplate subunit TssF [Burkholderia cepacia]RQZ68910.1 type VI secretion system baseplate subunit TssF [Burkholderia cepacia]
MKFLDHYNEELRQLRDAGARFANEHPQVAAALGLHLDAVTDPFVERLLEGVAYLSARVHTRLDRECAEFAQQALARVCPLFTRATPALTTFALHPALDSPETFRGSMLPRGSLIAARLPGRKLPVTFATARDVTLLPLRLAKVECSRSLNGLPTSLAQRLASSPAVLRFSFELEGVSTIGELKRGEAGFEPLHLTLAGDLPHAYALHQALLASSSAWYATVPNSRGNTVLALPMDGIRISGVDDAEALLPVEPGGLTGLRLLREYFAQPTRLLGVYLDALSAVAGANPSARSFELFFALREVPNGLVGEVNASQFRLFATPAINLYPKRFDPVPYDPNRTEQWIPVTRMSPAAHHLWSLTEVRVCESNGKSHPARPVLETGGYETSDSAIRYSLRREDALFADGVRRDRLDPLASHDLIAVSTLNDTVRLDSIASIAGRALVADRDWRTPSLLDAELSLLDPVAVQRIECLRSASTPRGIPAIDACWEAVSHLGRNPLALKNGQSQDITARVIEQLSLAIDHEDALDRQRVDSLRSVRISACFVAAGRATPLALVRATRVEIDVAASAHADRGGWLFGRLLGQALAEAVTLNDGIEVAVKLDGELVSTHLNTTNVSGGLS